MNQLEEVKNWSGYPRVNGKVYHFRTSGELRKLLRGHPKMITRGSGLSYGDASLGEHIISTKLYNKVIEFDRNIGIIRAESGMTLGEVLKIIVPEGWFLPVTPGTKFITLGGAVAADIHGKNHHKEGSFCKHVKNLRIMMADGVEINCSEMESPDLFFSTCGGMGLTGVIMEIDLKLKKIESAKIIQKNIICPDLKSLISNIKENQEVTYSVAWIDCMAKGNKMGRGVLMLGEHTKYHELPISEQEHPFELHKQQKVGIPFHFPSFVLNRYVIQVFNYLYYVKHKISSKLFLVHYDQFFYPLDYVKNWNKLYGKRGFLQYQFVIPFEKGEKILPEIIRKISQSGHASFLGVLKLLGEDNGSLSFPMKGYTLALDLPITNQIFAFLDQMDRIIVNSGGRLYLAKDARAKREILSMGYPQVSGFKTIRKLTGAKMKFESLMSRRLGL